MSVLRRTIYFITGALPAAQGVDLAVARDRRYRVVTPVCCASLSSGGDAEDLSSSLSRYISTSPPRPFFASSIEVDARCHAGNEAASFNQRTSGSSSGD